MKICLKKCGVILTLICLVFTGCVFGHSGRTDSSGGHRDNKNKSGLGSYHYHCGGYPAHLHNNGICPYTSTSIGSTETTQTSTKIEESTIEVRNIEINKDISNMMVGNTEYLTVNITPNNATDQDVEWNSSDESVVTVNSNGKITAKKPGTVYITATASNNKSSRIKVVVEDKEENSDEANPVITLLGLGMIGGGYFGYKKYKNKKQEINNV